MAEKKAIEKQSTYTKYANKWIAISPDETKVVGSGKTIKEAISEALKRGIKNPILTKLPKRATGYLL